jgi:hypothetical protein
LEVSGQQHALAVFNPRGENVPYTHRKGGWVGPKAGLDDMEKSKTRETRDSNLKPQSSSPHAVAIPTALPQLTPRRN